MLFALFDEDCDLVGSIDPDNHIYNTDMDCGRVPRIRRCLVAQDRKLAWSGRWVALPEDHGGHPVAWNPKERVSGLAAPLGPRVPHGQRGQPARQDPLRQRDLLGLQRPPEVGRLSPSMRGSRSEANPSFQPTAFGDR